jgi:hypothetical protein
MENVVFKRKFRWTIEATLPGGKIEPTFVKVNHRPNLNIEETEVKTEYGTTWVPGKAEWEALTITMWDMSETDQKNFWPTALPSMVPDPAEYPAQDKLGTFKLVLYDGCGVVMEEWELQDAFISAMRFEDTCSPCDPVGVEFTIRYKNVKYTSNCGPNCGKCTTPNRPSASSNMAMGLGALGGRKMKCPKCEHEFTTPGNCNIVF